MNEGHLLDWNKEDLRTLRLRLGWSRSDLARRLKCSIEDIESWEDGSNFVGLQIKGELDLMYIQCQACSDEIKFSPASEIALDKNALEQIDFSRVKEDFE